MRNFSKSLAVGFLTMIFLLGSYETAEARRFWGKEYNEIIQVEDLEGNCREYYVERRYIFWIKIKESDTL